jgi:hypothetical protein
LYNHSSSMIKGNQSVSQNHCVWCKYCYKTSIKPAKSTFFECVECLGWCSCVGNSVFHCYNSKRKELHFMHVRIKSSKYVGVLFLRHNCKARKPQSLEHIPKFIIGLGKVTRWSIAWLGICSYSAPFPHWHARKLRLSSKHPAHRILLYCISSWKRFQCFF